LIKHVRWRYLALRVLSPQPVPRGDLTDAVWDAVLRLFGEHGASRANLGLVEHDPDGNRAVLRCPHTALDMVRASLASITEIRGKPVAIHVVGVSGTLKSLRERLP